MEQLVESKAGMEFNMDFDDDAENNLDFGISSEAEIRLGLDNLLSQAIINGLPSQYEQRWKNLIHEYADVFRLKLGNDPTAKVPPMVVKFND
jgi:hypothetical protein